MILPRTPYFFDTEELRLIKPLPQILRAQDSYCPKLADIDSITDEGADY